MPRDAQGVYTPPRNWQTDAANGVPFDPAKWQQQDADFAAALNDLPLRSVVPKWCEPGTDAATVNPGSLMEQNGKTYVRTAAPIWKQIGPGITDAAGIVADAVAEIRAGVAANLDTFPEIVAKIEEQLTSVEAGSLYAPLSHAHAIANVTGLQTALDGKQALIAYTESSSAPATPAVRDQWRNSTTGALYQRVQNGSDPIWQQIG